MSIKVISFKTTKTLEIAFKANKYCYDKNEGEILLKTIPDVIDVFRQKQNELKYIKQKINEKSVLHTIMICNLLYPNLNTYEAIEEVYKKVKKLNEIIKENDVPVNKFIKTNNEKLQYILSSSINHMQVSLSLVAKVAYLKNVIEAIENICI